MLFTTPNKMDYGSISNALQRLWDDQRLGRHQAHAPPHQLQVHEQDDGDRDASCWGESWSDDRYKGGHAEQPTEDSSWADANDALLRSTKLFLTLKLRPNFTKLNKPNMLLS